MSHTYIYIASTVLYIVMREIRAHFGHLYIYESGRRHKKQCYRPQQIIADKKTTVHTRV